MGDYFKAAGLPVKIPSGWSRPLARPVVRINVNIWYYEPYDVCSVSQGYISFITWLPGGEIMFTCTSDIVIKILIFPVTDLRVN